MEHTDTVIDTDRLPHDPKLPNGDVLIDIFSRITSMSDELHDPDGLLQTVLRDQEVKSINRNNDQMKILHKILAEVLEVKAQLENVQDTVDQHEAKFVLLEARAEIQ